MKKVAKFNGFLARTSLPPLRGKVRMGGRSSTFHPLLSSPIKGETVMCRTGTAKLSKIKNLLPLFLVFSLFLVTLPLYGETATPEDQKKIMEKVRIDQNLGAALDLDIPFKDEAGQDVTLRNYFGAKPVIITPVYYGCPMLCTLILNELVRTLRILKFDAGKEFNILTYSIDPKETPELAARKKKNLLAEYKRTGAEDGWHFLTGPQESITRLSDALGFYYEYDEKSAQYAHAAAIIIATPAGVLARYFTGIVFSPKDLRFALVEASGGKVGSPLDQVLLLCYHYDPETGKYGLVITKVLRLAGILTALALLGFIAAMLFKERRQQEALK